MARTRRRALLVTAVLLALALIAGRGAMSPADAQAPGEAPESSLDVNGVHIMPSHGSPGEAYVQRETAKGSGPLKYYGGPVMNSSTTYAIFWLPPGYSFEGTNGSDSSYESLVERYFNDVGGTSFYNVLTQYPDSSGNPLNSSTYGAAYLDNRAFPEGRGSAAHPLTLQDVEDEVTYAMQQNGWSPGLTNMFFVFTPRGVHDCTGTNRCAFTQYCAYHSAFWSGSDWVVFANMPDPYTDLVHCGTPSSPGTVDRGAFSVINVTSHEQFEAVSDPLPYGTGLGAYGLTGWTDQKNFEIGDKCAWTFGPLTGGGDVVLNHSDPYIVQEEWSNLGNHCVLSFTWLELTDVEPKSGPPGTALTLTGTAFVPRGTTLTFVFHPHTGIAVKVPVTAVTCAGTTSCTAAAPALPKDPSVLPPAPFPAGTQVDVAVNAGGQTFTLAHAFTYERPTLSSVAPTGGPAGTPVTLHGSQFEGKLHTAVTFVFLSSDGHTLVSAPAKVLNCTADGATCQVTAPALPKDPHTGHVFPPTAQATVRVTVGGLTSTDDVLFKY